MAPPIPPPAPVTRATWPANWVAIELDLSPEELGPTLALPTHIDPPRFGHIV